MQSLISGLLCFDDSQRLRAKDALVTMELFSTKTRLAQVPALLHNNLEDLLYYNAFNTDLKEMNPIRKGMLYYLAHRVISEKKFSYYKDIFRHVESLCSSKLDGFIRPGDIKRLPKSLRSTMHVIFMRFSRSIDTREVSVCLDDSLDDT